jgi:uncharacterized membrane protein
VRARSVFLVALAVAGFVIAVDLTAVQLGWAAAWEPFFADGSQRVLGSALSRSLPIPDSAVGAMAYTVDTVLGLSLLVRPVGMPTVALALAVVATAGAVASALLVGYQAIVVRSFCTLCLASAGVSWALAIGAVREARERHSAIDPSKGHRSGLHHR